MRNNKYSDLKIVGFPEKLESFREGRITAPVYVRVKPINSCNHGCRWCVYKSDRRGDEAHGMPAVASDMHLDMVEKDVIPREKMMEVIDDFQAMGVKAVTFSGGGEPLLHRDIVEFMEHTLRCGIDLSIITNGQLLLGSRAKALAYAKWVRVSMDYTNAQQMARTRMVPERLFEEVLENVQTFARLKRPGCDLGVNFIVHRENCDGLVDFAHELYQRGVENIRFSPMYCPDFVAYHEPIREKVEQQLREIEANYAGRYFAGSGYPYKLQPTSVNTTYDLHNPAHSPERKYTRCFFMQTVPVVGADQNVYACHNKAFDKKGLIGSIRDRSFRELWFSEEAKLAFEKLNPQCDCRHPCANDSKNRHIMNLVEAAQDNFV